MRYKAVLIVVLSSLCIAQVARAHDGTRIYIAGPGGTVTTYQGTPDNEVATSFLASRVFAGTFSEFVVEGNPISTTDFPGFQVAEPIGGISPGSSFSFSIAGPLMYFDYNNPTPGTGIYRTVQDKFAPGVVPQVALSVDFDFAITGNGPVAGFDHFSYSGPGDHGHITYTLLGNGATAGQGPDGVYAIPMNLSGGGLNDSQTFFLLLGKNVDLGTAHMNEAIRVANIQLVPEPASIGLLAVGGVALLARRRRRGFGM
jgi:hypothetical protein